MAMRATSPLADRPVSHEELRAIPDDGRRYELIGGEVYVAPAPMTKHQYVSGRLARLMEEFAFARQLGVVLAAPTDVCFTPYNVVQPDILFIHRDHADRIKETMIEGAPDIVVEILSASSRQTDLVRKMTLYADQDVPEYWVVDPEAESIAVHVLIEGRYVIRAASRSELPSAIFAGFTVDSADIFRMPEWLQIRTNEQG